MRKILILSVLPLLTIVACNKPISVTTADGKKIVAYSKIAIPPHASVVLYKMIGINKTGKTWSVLPCDNCETDAMQMEARRCETMIGRVD